MKMTKKIMSLAIVFAMVMAMSVSALAADITVDTAVNGEEYNAYKIFDVTKSGNGAYSYTIDSDDGWKGVVDAYLATTEGAGELTLTASANDATVFVVTNNGLDAAAFAKYLIEHKPSTVQAAATKVAADGKAELTVADAGYYLVDSTLGALCILNTTDESATIVEKNTVPTIDKVVWDEDVVNNDTTKGAWQEMATASYGEVVKFKLTVNVAKGSDDVYVVDDVIPAGMQYVEMTTAPAGVTPTPTNTGVKFTLSADLVKANNEQAVVIEYTAKVLNTAVVNTNLKNEVTLTYKAQSDKDEASVYTYNVLVFKYTGENTPLANAEFVLKDSTGAEVKLTKVVEAGKTTVYQVNEQGTDKIVTDETGKLDIHGLDEGTYTLTETVAPAGYNMLDKAITIVIAEDGSVTVDGDVATDKTVNVLNETGTELPSTGGIGTTIFYALGGLMAVGAGVLLVAKKRMEA